MKWCCRNAAAWSNKSLESSLPFVWLWHFHISMSELLLKQLTSISATRSKKSKWLCHFMVKQQVLILPFLTAVPAIENGMPDASDPQVWFKALINSQANLNMAWENSVELILMVIERGYMYRNNLVVIHIWLCCILNVTKPSLCLNTFASSAAAFFPLEAPLESFLEAASFFLAASLARAFSFLAAFKAAFSSWTEMYQIWNLMISITGSCGVARSIGLKLIRVLDRAYSGISWLPFSLSWRDPPPLLIGCHWFVVYSQTSLPSQLPHRWQTWRRSSELSLGFRVWMITGTGTFEPSVTTDRPAGAHSTVADHSLLTTGRYRSVEFAGNHCECNFEFYFE